MIQHWYEDLGWVNHMDSPERPTNFSRRYNQIIDRTNREVV